jgi:hypothetical protein
MADGYPPSVAIRIGQPTHVLEIEVVGVWSEVEVHVDIDVKLTRHREDAVDLAMGVGVSVGRGAHHAAARLEGFDHQRVGPGIIQ